jgi:hypothetical protein
LYDPWTSDTLDPKTGVPVRPKKYWFLFLAYIEHLHN